MVTCKTSPGLAWSGLSMLNIRVRAPEGSSRATSCAASASRGFPRCGCRPVAVVVVDAAVVVVVEAVSPALAGAGGGGGGWLGLASKKGFGGSPSRRARTAEPPRRWAPRRSGSRSVRRPWIRYDTEAPLTAETSPLAVIEAARHSGTSSVCRWTLVVATYRLSCQLVCLVGWQTATPLGHETSWKVAALAVDDAAGLVGRRTSSSRLVAVETTVYCSWLIVTFALFRNTEERHGP